MTALKVMVSSTTQGGKCRHSVSTVRMQNFEFTQPRAKQVLIGTPAPTCSTASNHVLLFLTEQFKLWEWTKMFSCLDKPRMKAPPMIVQNCFVSRPSFSSWRKSGISWRGGLSPYLPQQHSMGHDNLLSRLGCVLCPSAHYISNSCYHHLS